MIIFRFCFILFLFASCNPKHEVKWNESSNNNPLLPGYFADPTIKKFDETYYIYATTDGVKLASGQPTVWISKNLTDWYNYELDIKLPEGLTNCWAPDVLKGSDGKYYYFMGNCQFGCNIYAYVSDNPVGPWLPVNKGEPVIPVGTGTENLPALDAQFLQCSNSDLYSYFGTWCHVFKGLGWAKIDPNDMHTILKSGYIPLKELPQVFEAAYPVERNGKYILMYSSGDCRKSSYAVHYAYANHPTGPYTYGDNNPILSSNFDYTIDGPGHHSIIDVNGQYYIIYHRHDNPHSSGGEFRQIAADKLKFINDSTIEKVTPTHSGINDFGLGSVKPKNIALKSSVSASSYYHLNAEQSPYTHSNIDYAYLPEYAVDDNNGTIWKAASGKLPQTLTIDLGKNIAIKRILTEFEYTTFYYQYKIEVSTDNKNWVLFADNTKNQTSGCPMIDDNDLKGRYVKLTIIGTENAGMFAAVWNMKVFNKIFDVPEYKNKPCVIGSAPMASNMLEVVFDAKEFPSGQIANEIANTGALKGQFTNIGKCQIKEIEKIKALYLNGGSYLELSKPAPATMNWNAPYSISAWVYSPELTLGQCIFSWNTRDNMLQASYAAIMYGTGNYGAVAHGDGSVDIGFNNIPAPANWHQITVTFDGMLETVYVNGKKDRSLPLNLFVTADKIRIGASGEDAENFEGYIANLYMYNKSLSFNEVEDLYVKTNPKYIKD